MLTLSPLSLSLALHASISYFHCILFNTELQPGPVSALWAPNISQHAGPAGIQHLQKNFEDGLDTNAKIRNGGCRRCMRPEEPGKGSKMNANFFKGVGIILGSISATQHI